MERAEGGPEAPALGWVLYPLKERGHWTKELDESHSKLIEGCSL